ncbi:MAG: type III-A CRISPR-associated protein Cas10/Csm1 [Bacteroidales bacterium]|nr:type III-A CRISPR-associated protein Cas10/Csm1 [Bacteroidales bacterium]
MDNTREKIYLAALLHDIGKFYQRADGSFSERKFDKNIKTMVDYICPQKENGAFGYLHSAWTLQFLEEVFSKIQQISGLKDNLYDASNPDSIFQLAAYHHKPATELQALISLADWWSAGIDRRVSNLEKEEGEQNGINWGKQRYKRIPLYSVFNKINKGNFQYAFGLKPLSIDEKGFFPSDIKTISDGNSQAKYAELWKSFKEEFEKLPTDSFEGFAESLMFLLKKYTWCIPSNTTDMANVSLFDHLKTTAAFADSLYLYMQEKPDDFVFNNNRLTLKEGVRPVILLGGDLSGIQKFIYNIASRKAAVSLKGRSFYLQLLIDSIIQRIISHPDIEATLAHVVYSSGGKFYMILPNTIKVLKAILELKNDIEADIWKQHNGQLIVNIDYVPFAYNVKYKGLDFDDKVNQAIGELWRTLADKLAFQKNQKFKSVLLNEYENLFKPQDIDEDAKVCAVTGIEGKCVAIDSKEKGEKTYVLPVVKKQVELGNVLKDVDYVITYRGNDVHAYLNNKAKFQISCVGVDNYLFDQKELVDNEADFRTITSADVCRVKRINQTDFFIPIKGNSCGYGFQFYGGNKQAKSSNGDNKTFEELAKDSYLGILRMDVDNLGSIFIQGLPDEDKSFAAYSTLSFMLDYFFSGYLNTIRENENFKDDVNILYSGGDDVFAVGKWNKLIEFAEAIRENFRKFVGRDDISISGGIAIVDDKFPVAKAAEMAGEAEDAAKKYKNSAKNAFNMFGESVVWSKEEYGYVKSYKLTESLPLKQGLRLY